MNCLRKLRPSSLPRATSLALPSKTTRRHISREMAWHPWHLCVCDFCCCFLTEHSPHAQVSGVWMPPCATIKSTHCLVAFVFGFLFLFSANIVSRKDRSDVITNGNTQISSSEQCKITILCKWTGHPRHQVLKATSAAWSPWLYSCNLWIYSCHKFKIDVDKHPFLGVSSTITIFRKRIRTFSWQHGEHRNRTVPIGAWGRHKNGFLRIKSSSESFWAPQIELDCDQIMEKNIWDFINF